MSTRANFQLLSAGDMSGDITTNPVLVDQFDAGFCIHAVTTSTGTGTLKVQASCDLGDVDTDGPVGASITNWVDVTGATASVTGAGSYMINCSNQHYRWARLVYTRSSNSGTMTIRVNGKGAA